ncbi:hypothetical protein [Candidatus Bathycorpusculum sp.]|uniref:hypothetical protein n=1 Tax=Candidatus Bathycorpusculum sp. TaxID=2994959 RepID=UPI002837DF87|nr:hypothetical protein [Candidatus Termitimicrobium sp.]MCL2432611.1 hypothetical protein [Candidatus Termitimicrobium sp.]
MSPSPDPTSSSSSGGSSSGGSSSGGSSSGGSSSGGSSSGSGPTSPTSGPSPRPSSSRSPIPSSSPSASPSPSASLDFIVLLVLPASIAGVVLVFYVFFRKFLTNPENYDNASMGELTL